MFGNKALEDRLKTYERSAKERNLAFTLTEHEFQSLILGDCYYCGTEPPLKTEWNYKKRKLDKAYCNGIDRLDNKKGYIPDNCLTCCIKCNRMKMDMSIEEFFTQISRIYNNRIQISGGQKQ